MAEHKVRIGNSMKEIEDVLAEIRSAFDGDDLARKNRALRWSNNAIRDAIDRIAALEAQLAAERAAHAETKQERDEALNQLCSMMYDRDTHRAQCKKLLTQRDEALKALEPFAKAGDLFPGEDADFDQCIYRPAAGDEYALSSNHLRAARRALEGGE